MFEEIFRESYKPLSPPLFEVVNLQFDYKGAVPLSELEDVTSRHKTGDWGECSESEIEANETALKHGGCVLSVFRNLVGEKFCVLTEEVGLPSSYTSILFYSDYLKIAG